MTAAIRPGQDSDADAIIRLIGDCWAEYPGCVLDVDGELPELRALASWFAASGGALWMAGDGAGMVGVRPHPDEAAWELCKVYVAREVRGGGLAPALLDIAEGHARAHGAGSMLLWTDTRFHRAHSFYEKRGYVRCGPIRVLDDISRSLEFRYAKPLRGLVAQMLDAAAAASVGRGLARLRPAGGAADAPPIAAGIAQGACLLVVAWVDGELAGALQLGLAAPGMAPHRGAMTALLLAPDHDRVPVARALLGEAEAAAAARGKRLITAEWPANDPAAAAFHAQGWDAVGRVPGGLAGAVDGIIFCKALPSGIVATEATVVGR